jgi:uncharacterized protein involved in exopolysaccharide biosynthesis
LTQPANKDEITLSELLQILWQEKWLVIVITILAAGASVTYALVATEWFRAETLLVPAEQNKGGLADGLGALGGLAGIAGINLGNDNSAEPLATLKSAEFIGAFIEQQNLLPVLFADKWDAKAKAWKGSDVRKHPDLRDGVRYFTRRLLDVNEDTKTRLVVVTVTWTDAAVAARWTNMLIERLNARMRDRALREAERNIAYLHEELAKANVVALQETTTRLLESQMQKMMVARGNSEYSFRVVDRAQVPKWRSSPKRVQVCLLGTIGGGLLAVFIAVARGRRRRGNS